MRIEGVPVASAFLSPIALIAACALPGCDIYAGDIDGQDGVLSFYEPREYPADSGSSVLGFERPIALGARADVWVLGPGLGTLEAAEIDAPEVVSVFFNSYPIELRAQSEGTTTLRVTASNGSDSLPLSVVGPAGAHVWVLSTPPLFGKPDGYYGDGYALRPGATLRVAAEPRAGTTALLGFDLFEWSIDPELLAHEADARIVNTRRIEALGQSGIARIATQLGGDLEIATLSAEDMPALKLYSFASDLNNPPEITEIAPNDVDGFVLVGNDAAGRYVQPSTQDHLTFAAAITDGSVVLLDAELSDRYVSLRACAGVGTLQISYIGAERSVPIEVTPDVADESCPSSVQLPHPALRPR
jgi:hypothetical protein